MCVYKLNYRITTPPAFPTLFKGTDNFSGDPAVIPSLVDMKFE